MTQVFNSQTVYREMLRSRLFETAVKELWDRGLISGEMHMGMGEEAIVAGVVSQLIRTPSVIHELNEAWAFASVVLTITQWPSSLYLVATVVPTP